MSWITRLSLAAASAAALACGNATSPPPQGTVFFRMDAASCKYTGAKKVTFYIATSDVGTESIHGGGTSLGYLTKASSTYPKPGNPVVQARIANYTATGGALWTGRIPVEVLPEREVTHIVVC